MANDVSHVGLVIDDKYEIESILGSGGIATVYRATRRLIGDTVAIKILHPEQVRDPQSAERFRREAQAAARLKHPNAVTIHDFGVSADGLIYLVMELVEGKSIREMIREQGPLSQETTAEILRQACAALEEAHKHGIVHRDIKPDNIVVAVTPKGLRVKVLDFGIARIRDNAASSLTQTGSVMGTPYYMSPEQCLGEELDHRSDVYSLGIVLFEMLVGIVPFNSPTSTAVVIQHVNQAPPPLRMINISISPSVEQVVLRALSKRREDRPQSAQMLADEFTSALGGDVAISGSNGRASISAREDLASTMRMSMPAWSSPATQVPRTSGQRESRHQAPWVWVMAAAIPVIAVAGWFVYSSSTRADSGASGSSDSISMQRVAAVKSIGSDTSRTRPLNPQISVAPATTMSNQLTVDQRNAAEKARRPSYLNVSSLPAKVDFVVYAASSGRPIAGEAWHEHGLPMNNFASDIAKSLRSRNKTASASVFSPTFVTSGAFESFFDGGGGAAMRTMPLSSMGNLLVLARVDVRFEVTQGTSVEGLVTASAKVAFAVLSTKDGRIGDRFTLSSIVAGISKDAAAEAALDRILEDPEAPDRILTDLRERWY